MTAGPSRVRRLFDGWSANLVQVALGVTQQVALIPIFLHYWSSEVLAGWLAIYAAGNLVLIADAGLHLRTMNRFLLFKSGVDADGRTARYYAAMFQVYLVLTSLLVVAVMATVSAISPSRLLGFQAVPNFDIAFIVMVLGMLTMLPSNLAAGLYRARGLYGRGVWIPCIAQLIAQLGQVVTIVATGDLLTVVISYVVPQILFAIYLLAIDARRCFPFLHPTSRRVQWSWRWAVGQLRRAFPFAIASGTEIVSQNLSVLLVSALVLDRVAVAQWGLTRVAAGLLRAVCTQVTLPLAAELGHDHAVGATARLRSLYARGSILLALLVSVLASGLLAFWPDFFGLWTKGVIPYDAHLTFTLLIGTGMAAPAILALGYAYCSDRGELLARSKGVQLLVFLLIALALTPKLGPLGMAIAIVGSDLLVQLGWLGLTIIRQTLVSPARHILSLYLTMTVVVAAGWALGTLIGSAVPGTGLAHFVAECALWLLVMGLAAVPFTNPRVQTRLGAIIPN